MKAVPGPAISLLQSRSSASWPQTVSHAAGDGNKLITNLMELPPERPSHPRDPFAGAIGAGLEFEAVFGTVNQVACPYGARSSAKQTSHPRRWGCCVRPNRYDCMIARLFAHVGLDVQPS